ncbi:MAG TPA: 2Fe-2S iron-sulfur cluster-binding protein [Vicinamibacterales bacterium]|jgi:NADH-quinone oxidoreductase subunit G
METVTLTIDGRQVTVEKGRTVLQAAIDHGIQVPYYCYHPGLGVDGSCRVCIVKIEKMPKLQTACSTMCTDGMVVSTTTPDVVQARAGVFEFLLINHPLDCPVCDKGGECPLQDFSYSFGPRESRMEFPRRVFDGEGVRADVDFGPSLMLNRNRCILCTRCIRFMRDVDGDAQIGIADRGYGSELATYKEQGVHSLLSGNLMDVCPVGAITTRDYRFKSRPWDNPLVVDTTCTSCSKGCNTSVWIKAKPEWAKGARIVRVTPRFNPAVNGYWMCDIGRFEYHWVENDERRIRTPMLRDATGMLAQASWSEALRALGGERRSRLRFLLSAHASLEEIYLFQRIAGGLVGQDAREAIAMSWRYRPKTQPPDTRFTVPPVDAPNVTGARDLGVTQNGSPDSAPDISRLRRAIDRGDVAAVYVFDPGPDGSIGDVAWLAEARTSGKVPLLLYHGVLMTELAQVADIVLPGATSFEKDASYTNDRGIVQAVARVNPPPGDAMEDWQALVHIAATLGVPMSYTNADQVRTDVGRVLAGNPSYAAIAQLSFARPTSARTWLQASNPSERWKWDFLFQDLPPVKFAGGLEAAARELPAGAIPLKKVDG